MSLHENLKSLRKAHGVTQVQLAKVAGMSYRHYQYIEAGESKPSFDGLIALADFFEVSLDDLVGRTPRLRREIK